MSWLVETLFIFHIIVNVIIILILLAVIILLVLYEVAYFSDPPFVPAPYAVLPYISKQLQLKGDSVLYDLGCGDCRVLLQCYLDSSRTGKFIGVDKNSMPVWLARLRMRKFIASGAFQIRQEDFFQADISDATHIFIYGLPKVMPALTLRLKSILKPGTRVISMDFKLAMLEKEIFSLNRPYRWRGRNLYIYEF